MRRASCHWAPCWVGERRDLFLEAVNDRGPSRSRRAGDAEGVPDEVTRAEPQLLAWVLWFWICLGTEEHTLPSVARGQRDAIDFSGQFLAGVGACSVPVP